MIIIDSNCAFRAADADNDKYTKMFPDSATANSYQQKTDKVKQSNLESLLTTKTSH